MKVDLEKKELTTIMMCIGTQIMVQLTYGTMTDIQYIEVKKLYKKIEEKIITE